MSSEDQSEWVGRVVADRYRVLSCIGSGASANVFRAETIGDVEELEGGSEIALKVSKPHVLTRQRDAARFLREVKAVRRIDHPGCVTIYDWGITGDNAYIAMELLEGDDLHSAIRTEGRFSATRSIAIAMELCNVLMAAHEDGVVHRDLKPRNIVLLGNGEGGVLEPRLKVLDFGLAKLFRHETDDEETVPDALTRPGSVLGTPHYMAPEQVTVDVDIDGRADLYALCVILYEMLTGTRPYRAKNAVRLLVMRSSSDPTPPSEHRPDLEPELDRIIMRGLQRNPNDRFPSASALRRVLADAFPRIAENEADLSDAAIPPPSLDSSPSGENPDGESTEEGESREDVTTIARRLPSAPISTIPPDTIDDAATEADEDEPTRLRKRPDLATANRKPDTRNATPAAPKAEAEPTAKAEPRAEAEKGASLDPLYYVIAALALGATVARLLGYW